MDVLCSWVIITDGERVEDGNDGQEVVRLHVLSPSRSTTEHLSAFPLMTPTVFDTQHSPHKQVTTHNLPASRCVLEQVLPVDTHCDGTRIGSMLPTLSNKFMGMLLLIKI